MFEISPFVMLRNRHLGFIFGHIIELFQKRTHEVMTSSARKDDKLKGKHYKINSVSKR